MAFLSPEYRRKVEPRLRSFVKDGNDVMCVGVFAEKGRQCTVCDHKPITYNFIIENLETHDTLIAGYCCVYNYEIILMEWGYKPEYIVFPTYFLRFAKWITEDSKYRKGHPTAIRLHDDFLERATVDAREVVKQEAPDAKLLVCVNERFDVEDQEYLFDPNDPRHPLPNIDNEEELDLRELAREMGCSPEDLEYDEDARLGDEDIGWGERD